MRVAILIVACCAIAGVVVGAPLASTSREEGAPPCSALLTAGQAADVMDEQTAGLVSREVLGGGILDCNWFGGTKGSSTSYGLGVIWGSFFVFRKLGMSPEFKKSVCGASKRACRELTAALDLSENPTDKASFSAIASALDRVGSIRPLASAAFDGDPAFLWMPGGDTGLENAPFVVVHARAQRRMLITICVENGTAQSQAPALPCAIRAAKRAYNNITG